MATNEQNIDLVSNHKEIKKMVWERELLYWNSLSSKNLPQYSSMLHSDFSDWPASAENPIGTTEGMIAFVTDVFESLSEVSFELDHKLTKILASREAIVYFNCKIKAITVEGDKIEDEFRMIHLWSLQNKVYKLTGGLQSHLQ